VVDCLAAHRIVLSELEGLQGWGADGADGQRFAELEPHVHAMADATGARHMQVWGSYTGAIKSAAERFGEVCDRAADHGLLVALEFLPFTNVFDAATALEIVERAGRPNGGICVDVWHHERGARCTEQLRAIPPECVVGVQLDDGARIPVDTDYYTDCVANRLPPGEGEFDVVGFLALLSDIGADAPLAVEVLSDAVQTSTPTDVAVHLAHATRGVRQAAGYSVSIL
jgi:sugar phosphate isomerase/epimerase